MQHNFKNLKIWMYAMDLTAEVHQITKLFPKHETYGLISQMNRAARRSFKYSGRIQPWQQTLCSVFKLQFGFLF